MAALYKALKAHKVAEDFNPHSLEVIGKATAGMREIWESAIDITRKAVAEFFDEHECVAANMKGADFMVEQRLATKKTVLKHVLADLGWALGQALSG